MDIKPPKTGSTWAQMKVFAVIVIKRQTKTSASVKPAPQTHEDLLSLRARTLFWKR